LKGPKVESLNAKKHLAYGKTLKYNNIKHGENHVPLEK